MPELPPIRCAAPNPGGSASSMDETSSSISAAAAGIAATDPDGYAAATSSQARAAWGNRRTRLRNARSTLRSPEAPPAVAPAQPVLEVSGRRATQPRRGRGRRSNRTKSRKHELGQPRRIEPYPVLARRTGWRRFSLQPSRHEQQRPGRGSSRQCAASTTHAAGPAGFGEQAQRSDVHQEVVDAGHASTESLPERRGMGAGGRSSRPIRACSAARP
jgi:hypothetical protein